MRVLFTLFLLAAILPAAPKKIVLIAGKKSHGPGAHEYVKSVRLLKVLLDRSPNLKNVRTEIHFNGWPEDPRTLDDADTIMTISDGQDGDKYSPVPFMTDERMRIIEKQMNRGCGFLTFHFSTFAPDKYGPQMLEWAGGYFDWQDDSGARNWYSKIKTIEADLTLAAPNHPITRGVTSLRMKEEFYYNIRFRPADPRLTPILTVPALGGQPIDNTVAWAVERANGGRGFATTTGHAFDHWKIPAYRKLILNAIAWTAHLDIPTAGVESSFLEETEVNRILVPKPVRTLLITGDNHPSHNWKETTPAIVEALENRGPEFQITITEDPEALAKPDLTQYGLIVLNYCNWTKPGLSAAAQSNFLRQVRRGAGVTVVHFANGAFHASLPQAPPSDWPDYRKIVARVWDHAKGKSSHDKYGPFSVRIVNRTHPITASMEDFPTIDELYFHQQGDMPVTVLAMARSNVAQEDAPMAFVYECGKGRIFQTVLGHSRESLSTHGAMQLLRRGSAWAAQRKP